MTPDDIIPLPGCFSAPTGNKVAADLLNRTRKPSSGIRAGDYGNMIPLRRALHLLWENWVTNQLLTGMHVHERKLTEGERIMSAAGWQEGCVIIKTRTVHIRNHLSYIRKWCSWRNQVSTAHVKVYSGYLWNPNSTSNLVVNILQSFQLIWYPAALWHEKRQSTDNLYILINPYEEPQTFIAALHSEKIYNGRRCKNHFVWAIIL